MKNLLTILFLIASVQSFAQVKANLSQLEFMSGLWTGKMEWGNIEEFWSKPAGDNMICTFRLTNDGQAQFYEFIVIEQSESGVPVMRLRHFSRGNIAWEEKDKPYEYPIVKLEKNKAVFEAPDQKTRLIYERVNASQLRAVLEREKNGSLEVDEFIYQLAR